MIDAFAISAASVRGSKSIESYSPILPRSRVSLELDVE